MHSLYLLKKRLRGSFLIPKSVEYECIIRPMKMKEHAIYALRLKRAVADGVINVVDMDLSHEIEQVKWTANNMFFARGKPIHLIHEGEAEMLALANALDVKNLLIDERTTRLLVENPQLLQKHLEEEFHTSLDVNDKYVDEFARMTKNMSLFRSCEMLALAYEHGYFDDYRELKHDALEAALYRLKYSGCAVGMRDIEEYAAKVARESPQ
jgi:hypothetical protein